MVWKMKLRNANKGSPASLGSSPGSHDSSISTTRYLPSKSCLHASDSMSSNSLAGMVSASGSHSSVRSETEKILLCDQSSSHHSETTSQKGCLSYHDSLDNRLKGQSTTPGKLTTHSAASASSASSSSSKKVKFSVVEIRDYERQVGDNPSCTDGCPISIGWSHIDSRVLHLNQYEYSRPYRRAQLEMVLTRDEREELLAEWGAKEADIVSGKRALLKAKNQRRQTVRNLGKASVEEGIESATRKLKKLLSLKKSTKEEVESLQRQAKQALSAFSSRREEYTTQESSGASSTDGDEQLDLAPKNFQEPYYEINEADGDILDSLFDVKLGPAGVSDTSGGQTREATTERATFEEEAMDNISCISGFTLGNSTTASAKEIEKFHQELEVELFGDQAIPILVGRTLEVEVDVDIPEESKVYDDPSVSCGMQEPPSVVSDLLLDESVVRQSARAQEIACRRNLSLMRDTSNYSQPYSSMEASYQRNGDYVYGSYQLQTLASGAEPRRYNYRIGGSLGSTSTPEHRPSYPRSRQGPRLADLIPYSSGYSAGSFSTTSTMSTYDGPQVSHVPLMSHLTPNNWMEGASYRQDLRRPANQYEAVIISEEDDSLIDHHFMEEQPLSHRATS